MTERQQTGGPALDASAYTPPAPRSMIARIADFLRRLLDRFTGYDPEGTSRISLPAAAWVGLFALAAGVLGYFVTAAIPETCDVSLMRLEVTFSAARFKQLLAPLEVCGGPLVTSFVRDIPFCLVYPLALVAAYLWAERWRRFEHRPDGPDVAAAAPRIPIHDLLLIAPFIAGALDLFVENSLLWHAGQSILGGTISWWTQAEICIASLAAATKWILIFMFVFGLWVELMAGPRGVLLRRLRFSLLAVVAGAASLAATDPGLDILQRVVEPPHPKGHLAFAIAWLVFSATAVWYCGRRLVQLDFTDSGGTRPRPNVVRDKAWRGTSWYGYFAAQLPRIFGTAMLALAGVGFARAGLAMVPFAVLGGLSVVAVVAIEVAGRKNDPKDNSLAKANRIFRRRLVEAVVVTVLIAALPFWPQDSASGEITRAVLYHRVAAAIVLGLAWFFALFVYYRRERKAAWRAPADAYLATVQEAKAATIEAGSAQVIPRELKTKVAWASVASIVALLLFTADPVGIASPIGVLGILALFVANTVFVGSVLVWLYDRFNVPVVRVALGLAVLFGVWNDNHDVPLVRGKDGVAPLPTRVTLDSQFSRWRSVRLAEQGADTQPVPVYLVAAAGGGLRAAYWTAAVLAKAQDSNPQFAPHLFAISGVSGGSLGAAVFAALVRDAGTNVGALPCATDSIAGGAPTDTTHGKYMRCVHRFMERDFLSPVLSRTIAPDLAQRFLPFPIHAFDRSKALEESWSTSYLDATNHDTFRMGLDSMSVQSAALTVPTLFLNSTHVESGKRYIATPVLTEGALADQRDVLALLNADVPLAGAVHNSARFTYLSPAGHLVRDEREYGRVVDGGYFENSGLVTLREIYQRVVLNPTRIRPIVIYLCNDPIPCANDQRRSTTSAPASGPGEMDPTVKPTYMNEIMSPLRAVLDARDARGALARDEFQREGMVFLQFNVCDKLHVDESAAAQHPDSTKTAKLQHDRAISPPLSWLLSDLARDWMDRSLVRDDRPASDCVNRNVANLDILTHSFSRPGGRPN